MIELIEAHADYLRLEGYSERTIADRTRLLLRLRRHLLPNGLVKATSRGIQQFLARKDWERWTRCTYDMHIRSAYEWWCTNGYLDGNPVTWRAPRRPKCIPRPASDQALHVALSVPEPIRTAVLLAAYEGLRAFEIACCRREHITETTLYVPRGKGGNPAMLVTHPIVWEAVCNRPAGFLVVNHRTGRPVSGAWVVETARRWLARAGLDDRMHGMRHWYATTLLRQGANLRVVQECMRHASISSTVGYTKVVDEQRRAAVLALPVPGRASADQ